MVRETSERRARAIELYRAGRPVAEIARAVGCSRKTLYRWLGQEPGLERRRKNHRPITHGTHSGYMRGCKCEPCRAVQTRKVLDFRARDPERTRRVARQWREQNREHLRAYRRDYMRRYRARRKAAEARSS